MSTVKVELVFALPSRQFLNKTTLPSGSTVKDLVASSGVEREFPGHDFSRAPLGIWGRRVSAEHKLQDGDRVEIYRPLAIDPREARRELASQGKYMGGKGAQTSGDSS